MPQFPPLPKTTFDPFGSLASGFLMGMDYRQKLAEHGLKRAVTEAELQDKLMKQQALQQYATTGDVSALRGYSPETEQAIRFSKAQEQVYKLQGAKEYLVTVLPFLRREQVPQLYKTLQQQFGIDTSGWSVPKSDQEFEQAKASIWARLTGAKPPETHAVVTIDPFTGKASTVWRGTDKPHLGPTPHVMPTPGGYLSIHGGITMPPKEVLGAQPTTGYKLYRNEKTGEDRWMHPSQVPPGWVPVEKPLVQEVIEDIFKDPRLTKELGDAAREGRAMEYIEAMIQSRGYKRPVAPGTTKEAVERYKELIKKHGEYLKRLKELESQPVGVGP